MKVYTVFDNEQGQGCRFHVDADNHMVRMACGDVFSDWVPAKTFADDPLNLIHGFTEDEESRNQLRRLAAHAHMYLNARDREIGVTIYPSNIKIN